MFRKIAWIQLLVLAVAILAFGRWAAMLPDRSELGERTVEISFEPVSLDPSGFAPLHLAGAWRLTSDDPRVGGVSALAAEGTDLVAVTDSGVVIRIAKPAGGRSSALIRELPDGPGGLRYKSQRDSEALLSDPRGWWVAFENRNQLWLYDKAFESALRRIDFGPKRWPRNRGLEALSRKGASLLLLPERGRKVVEGKRSYAIENPAGWISDAARLPSGELLVLNRNPTPFGFSNSIATLKRTATGFRYVSRIRLGVGPLDNVEALATERLTDGRTRLWLMTDDNFQRPLRTLLIALDWPRRPEPRPASSKSRA